MKRLANMGTIVISLVVFAVAFLALIFIGEMQRPETISVLVASKDLQIGDVLSPDNLVIKKIVKDENAPIYIVADEAEKYYGGSVTLPFKAGQPIYATSVIPKEIIQSDGRLLPLAQEYGYKEGDVVLFPVKLDNANITAPDINTLKPGDVIYFSFVVPAQPQPRPTPMPEVPYGYLGYGPVAQPTAVIAMAPQPTKEKSPLEEYVDNVYPPLATVYYKGVRVIYLTGTEREMQQEMDSEASTSVTLSAAQKSPIVYVLIPKKDFAKVSLLMEISKVTMAVSNKEQDLVDGGYSYWDFSEELEKTRKIIFTPEPTPAP